ncbi:MAG: sensor histidine kinase [Hyphomicrobiales bacterium]
MCSKSSENTESFVDNSELILECFSFVNTGVACIKHNGDIRFTNESFKKAIDDDTQNFENIFNINIFSDEQFRTMFNNFFQKEESSLSIIRNIQITEENELSLKINLKKSSIQSNEDFIFLYLEEIDDNISKKNNIAGAKQENFESFKGAFLASLSHEIRTPLTHIIGFLDLIKDESILHEEREEYLNIIEDSSRSLLNLIENIIEMSKIESGYLKIKKSNISFDEISSEVSSIFNDERSKVRNFKSKITFNKQVDIHNLEIHTDIDKLFQILKQLIENAFKFSSNGNIEFGYRVNDNYSVKFWIKDEGIGIEKSFQYLIFNSFTQLDSSLNRQYGGVGLGLSIVKGLVKLLGGNIGVNSAPKKGSEFYFILPDCVQHLEMNNNKYYVDNKWKEKTICIIDQSKIDTTIYKELLKETNLSIDCGFDISEFFIKKYLRGEYDLIIIDKELFDAFNQLIIEKKQVIKEVPIFLQIPFSMYQNNNYKNENIKEIISKPINKNLLIKKLKKHLDK